MSEQETSAAAAETTNEAAGANGGDNGQATPAAPEASQGASDQNILTSIPAQAEGEGSEEKADEKKAQGGEEKSEEGEKKEEVKEGAPEQYADFTVPEGVEFDDQVISSFKDVAKELNLSQKQAQYLLDKCAPVIAQRQIEQIQAVSNQWIERSKTDKEIGGENWTRAASDIARVRDKFSVGADGKVDPDIQEFMNLPIGNHPGLLKLLARVGRAFGEADFPRGSAERDGKISPAQFYESASK